MQKTWLRNVKMLFLLIVIFVILGVMGAILMRGGLVKYINIYIFIFIILYIYLGGDFSARKRPGIDD